ncbi:formamidopyrimidine-DNA glycosylase-like [Andrographis paniculata]|uniref:formamidopyrimidine-DNA glycosylase-like n=1 Tax=Andrographis paniculata TaxID=175694 RepID=UPI0021E9299F|nr:formamidopyrimidine-DNA glycosylase-like [Andrographis paniculata]
MSGQAYTPTQRTWIYKRRSVRSMPELPEVQAARRAVEEHCVGKKINKCTVADDSKVIDGVFPKDFESALAGKTIVAAHRKGKNMGLELDSPPFPTFQFGASLGIEPDFGYNLFVLTCGDLIFGFSEVLGILILFLIVCFYFL